MPNVVNTCLACLRVFPFVLSTSSCLSTQSVKVNMDEVYIDDEPLRCGRLQSYQKRKYCLGAGSLGSKEEEDTEDGVFREDDEDTDDGDPVTAVIRETEIHAAEDKVQVWHINLVDQLDSQLSDNELEKSMIEEPDSYLGRDGKYVWKRHKPSRHAQHAIDLDLILESSGFKDLPGGDLHCEFDIWSLFFTDDMLQHIVNSTNEEILRKVTNFSGPSPLDHSVHEPTDIIELKALIGCLYMAALHPPEYLDTEQLYQQTALYPNVIPKERFIFLVECLRFESKRILKELPKLAQIHYIWNAFNDNCLRYINLAEFGMIKSKLWDFYGKCPFRVRDQTQEEYYGIKVAQLMDPDTDFIVNSIPFCGQFEQMDKFLPEITRTIHGSGRSLVVDHTLMSVQMTDKMLTDYNLRVIGPLLIRSHCPNREIPSLFLPSAKRKRQTVKTAYTNNSILVSYCDQNSTAFVMLSTLDRIDPNKVNHCNLKPEPDLVRFYLEMKMQAQAIEKNTYQYSTARLTSRWALRCFYGLLDLASHNTWILSCELIYRPMNEAKKLLKQPIKYKEVDKQECIHSKLAFQMMRQQVKRNIERIEQTVEESDFKREYFWMKSFQLRHFREDVADKDEARRLINEYNRRREVYIYNDLTGKSAVKPPFSQLDPYKYDPFED